MIRIGLTALAVAAALGWLGPFLDGIDDHSDEWAQSQNLKDAQRAEAARQRFNQAAQRACGPQAAWSQVTNDTVQCRSRYGRKTMVATVKE